MDPEKWLVWGENVLLAVVTFLIFVLVVGLGYQLLVYLVTL